MPRVSIDRPGCVIWSVENVTEIVLIDAVLSGIVLDMRSRSQGPTSTPESVVVLATHPGLPIASIVSIAVHKPVQRSRTKAKHFIVGGMRLNPSC